MPPTTRRAVVTERAGLYVVEQRAVAPTPDWWPEGWVVALVHGAMDRSAGLARVARRLSELPVVRYDRRGYGHSIERGAGVLDDHVQDLGAVLAGRPAVVFGHSYGGVVALAAAAATPAAVTGVVAYEAPTPWEPWWPRWEPDRVDDRAGPGAPDWATGDVAGDAAERFLRSMVGDAVWERLPRSTRAARRAEGRSMLTEVASLDAANAAVPLADIRVPVVSAMGSRTSDRHRRGAQAIADEVPGAELVTVSGATHGAPLTHPVELADLIRHTARRAVAR